MGNKDYFKKEKKSFGYAFSGMAVFFRETRHAKVHFLATALVIALGLYLKVSITEWIALTICIALVFSLEAINSALEYTVDLASKEYHVLAKKAKDVAAAAVLIASLFCVVVAVLIFGPKLLELI